MSAASTRDQQLDKLRKACNGCNVAKIRCSGERSGCSRCRVSDMPCVYETSRVGKNPGLRAKKTRPRDELPQARRSSAPRHSMSQRSPPPRSARAEEAANNGIYPREPYVGHHHGVLENWPSDQQLDNGLLSGAMDDMFDGDFELEDPPPAPNSQHHRPPGSLRSVHSLSTASSTFLAGSVLSSSDFDNLDEPASSITSVTDDASAIRGVAPPSFLTQAAATSFRPGPSLQAPPPPAQPEMPFFLHSQTQGDSECVMACCSIISQLEAYIDAQVKVLDLALDCVRKAVRSLNEIVDQGSGSRYCHMLLAVSMYQIVYILERACKLFLDEHREESLRNSNGERTQDDITRGVPIAGSNKRRTNSLARFDGVGGMLSGFGFSSFSLDASEQRAFRARVVLKDVRQVTNITRRVIALATRDSPATNVEACHRDLIQRLESFALQLERVQND